MMNVDELFALAVQMEDNAARFYERVAEKHSGGAEETALLKRLADIGADLEQRAD